MAAAALVLAGQAPAGAVTRTCGANAATNTSNVLCASPSGPCTGTAVTISAPIDVLSGSCTFDLGGRTLTIDRVFDIVGTGGIHFRNVGNVTITDTGKLRARGDFESNPISAGGSISIESSGTISHDGVIDVSGDPSGMIDLSATGTVSFLPGSQLRGIGTSSYADDGARYADGGVVTVVSTGGSISVDGEILMNGENTADGGDVSLQAARDIDVLKSIEATGGASVGGSIDLTAGDNITVIKFLDVASRLGGGDGGEIAITAGADTLGGVASGGTLTIDGTTVKLEGSSGEAYGGSGGDFRISSAGSVLISADAIVRINAGTGFDGDAGSVLMTTADADPDTVGALDDDLTVQGDIIGKSGDSGGSGAWVTLLAGRDLWVSGELDLGGKWEGGFVQVEAGRTLSVAGPVQAPATAADGIGGVIMAKACDVSVTSSGALDAHGEWGGQVELISREQLTVNASSDVDASGWWGSIRLVTRRWGTCSNDVNRACTAAADCIVGCNAGSCVNVNPNTGGTLAQFSPRPDLARDTSLPSCP